MSSGAPTPSRARSSAPPSGRSSTGGSPTSTPLPLSSGSISAAPSQLGDATPAADLLEQTNQIQGLLELAEHARVTRTDAAPLVASAVEFVIEGLYARKKISRSDEWQYHATAEPQRATPTPDQFFEADIRIPRGKKKYYN